MAAQKEYRIVINGLTESINAVDSLNKQLDNLDKRINDLQSKNIKLNTSSGAKSALSEEEAIQREINKLKKEGEALDAKIVAAQDEVYKKVDATKQLYKETLADQKAIAAQERLTADAYSNTMQGMKSQLADLKAVINTTDLGDADKIGQMTKQANELTNKLKEMEEAYGQFGRNVGNYAEGVADGLSKVKINVGGAVREFDNAKQAAKTLGNELKTMAVNGEQGTDKFKELQKAVAQLNSDIKDATVSSKAMDNLLDTMQSFAAIGSVTQGFSALFGFDDAEIQRSIQKLVALQNVMQGIEKINQQMNSGEGIGGWLSKGNAAIDKFVAELTGANKAQEALNASTVAGKTASEGLAAAETAQAAATTTATVATKALSLALKTIGIGLIISAVAYLITYWKEIYNWFTDTIPALKNLSTWFDKIKAVVMGVGSAIANYLIQPLATIGKVINAIINREFDEIPKIIADGFKKTYNIIGNYQKGYQKEIERQQDSHNKKMREQQKKSNEEQLKDEEAKYGQSHKRTQEYLKKQMELTEKGSDEYKELQRKLWEDERREKEENQKKKLSDSKKAAKEESEVEKEIARLELSYMKDGLNKKLMQLEEEKRQTINKLKENANFTNAEMKRVEDAYYKLRLNTVEEYLKNLEKSVKDAAKEISQTKFQLNTKDLELQIKDINQEIDNINRIVPKINTLTTSDEYYPKIKGVPENNYYNAIQYEGLLNKKDASEEAMKEFLSFLDDWNNELGNAFSETYTNVATGLDEIITDYDSFIDYIEGAYAKELYAIREYGVKWNDELGVIDTSLNNSFEFRLEAQSRYNEKYISQVIDLINTEEELRKKEALEKKKQALSQNKIDYDTRSEALKNQIKDAKENQDDLIKIQFEKNRILTAEEEKHLYEFKELEIKSKKELEDLRKQYATNVELIAKELDTNLIDIENEMNEKRQSNQEKYFDNQISNYRDFLSKINQEAQKQPVTNAFGIVNIAKTKENYREILDASKTTLNGILKDKENLNKAFKKGLISSVNYNAILNQLNDLETDVNETSQEITEKNKQTFSDFVASIQMYLQEAMNSFNTIMNAVWDAQDVAFDKEQDEIDKMNDALDKQLDKQQEIIEEHKDKIDSIEDELANSRGDRRQHLIDQLNAEIAAERAAEKEKQRIQKQQEAAQKKQDALDLKRKKAEYKRNLLQAIVNGAMAVTMAAINTWPIPAIPMMSLAASTTAAQIAIMSANKPYAKGGQLDGGIAVGNRHRDGGIKVLGGRAEIEGGEFITNRISTQMNAPLLEFINSKKKRIDISDMIDFYSSGSVKKNIANVRTKFEDGGYMPTLPNALDVRDQLQNVIINQDNRPIYVSVVDINNKQEEVRKVQTLAGL